MHDKVQKLYSECLKSDDNAITRVHIGGGFFAEMDYRKLAARRCDLRSIVLALMSDEDGVPTPYFMNDGQVECMPKSYFDMLMSMSVTVGVVRLAPNPAPDAFTDYKLPQAA